MVKLLNGFYKVRHDRFLIEINKETHYTQIFVRETKGFKNIYHFSDVPNNIDCFFKAFDFINDYNKRYNSAM